MATNQTGCGCSSGCMGALRCVAGPLYHCPMPTANPDYYQDFPYYNGPCPPCVGDNCRRRCCHHCCHYEEEGCARTRRSAGMFTADAPLSAEAGGAISLEAEITNPDCFSVDNGCVRIHKSGLYHVVWTANIPSYQYLCARLYLALNGNEVPGSGQTICTQADNTSTSVTGQAMVQAAPNGLLCLNTDSDVDLDGSCSVENVFTLTITKVQ